MTLRDARRSSASPHPCPAGATPSASYYALSCCPPTAFWALTMCVLPVLGLSPGAGVVCTEYEFKTAHSHLGMLSGHLSPVPGEYLRKRLYAYDIMLREGAKT